ncbi:hypothetical protein [Amycolatopsis suaedae]|uniref:Uncharacterized protein n=1 Tax=Amycolatopsis suaedae TaxID=2510978 RepID=A0A4Q7J4T3_9PSEU|nr:hypothetical protein [Amycolatopsis suaedae]RZQ62580.1 hypothetical protein EWH70_16520 [Amycolatopsis suaedae]
MPIRTNRGRAAVYRRIWGWPLRSTTHLVVAIVVFVGLVVATGILVPKLAGDKPPATPSVAGQQSTTSSSRPDGKGPGAPASPLPTRLSEPLRTPTTAPPAPEALALIKQWATTWTNHPDGMTPQQWLDNLRPLTTEEYLPTLATVDLANIPASKVTGEPATTESFTTSVEAEIATDGPKLKITAVKTNVGWRVSAYDRVG